MSERADETERKEKKTREKRTASAIVAQWTFCALPNLTNEGQRIEAISWFSSLTGWNTA